MTFTEVVKNYKPKQTGGKGDGKTPYDVDLKELAVGLIVEFEHTNDPMVAMGIAIDHLSENETYYSIHLKSGLVDEPEALELGKRLLGIDLSENNKTDDEIETNRILGFEPVNPSHYTNMNENFDFVAAELEYFNRPETKEKLLKFEKYYTHWKDLSEREKNEAYALFKELKMDRFDTQC